MATDAYFQQIEQNINSLMADNRFNEAYKLCIQHLEENPDSKILIKAKERIEERVEEENEKIISKRLEEIKALIKEGKNADALRSAKPLLETAPGNKKLLSLINEAQDGYKEDIKRLQEEFDKKQRERLTKMLNEKPEELVEELFNLEKSNPGNYDIQKIATEFRDKLIEKKIKEKKALLDSDKYQEIINLIEQLKRIEPKNDRIKKLENIKKIQEYNKQISHTKDFSYEGEQHLGTLMKMHKYDEAIRAAIEILEVDKNNKFAAKSLKKAEKKAYATNRDIVAAKIQENLPRIKEDFKANRQGYIKI